jgi:hypothetical protein
MIAALEEATSGSVTYTTANGSTVTGSFDVTFPTSGHVTGTFSAPSCVRSTSGGSGSDSSC